MDGETKNYINEVTQRLVNKYHISIILIIQSFTTKNNLFYNFSSNIVEKAESLYYVITEMYIVL